MSAAELSAMLRLRTPGQSLRPAQQISDLHANGTARRSSHLLAAGSSSVGSSLPPQTSHATAIPRLPLGATAAPLTDVARTSRAEAKRADEGTATARADRVVRAAFASSQPMLLTAPREEAGRVAGTASTLHSREDVCSMFSSWFVGYHSCSSRVLFAEHRLREAMVLQAHVNPDEPATVILRLRAAAALATAWECALAPGAPRALRAAVSIMGGLLYRDFAKVISPDTHDARFEVVGLPPDLGGGRVVMDGPREALNEEAKTTDWIDRLDEMGENPAADPSAFHMSARTASNSKMSTSLVQLQEQAATGQSPLPDIVVKPVVDPHEGSGALSTSSLQLPAWPLTKHHHRRGPEWRRPKGSNPLDGQGPRASRGLAEARSSTVRIVTVQEVSLGGSLPRAVGAGTGSDGSRARMRILQRTHEAHLPRWDRLFLSGDLAVEPPRRVQMNWPALCWRLIVRSVTARIQDRKASLAIAASIAVEAERRRLEEQRELSADEAKPRLHKVFRRVSKSDDKAASVVSLFRRLSPSEKTVFGEMAVGKHWSSYPMLRRELASFLDRLERKRVKERRKQHAADVQGDGTAEEPEGGGTSDDGQVSVWYGGGRATVVSSTGITARNRQKENDPLLAERAVREIVTLEETCEEALRSARYERSRAERLEGQLEALRKQVTALRKATEKPLMRTRATQTDEQMGGSFRDEMSPQSLSHSPEWVARNQQQSLWYWMPVESAQGTKTFVPVMMPPSVVLPHSMSLLSMTDYPTLQAAEESLEPLRAQSAVELKRVVEPPKPDSRIVWQGNDSGGDGKLVPKMGPSGPMFANTQLRIAKAKLLAQMQEEASAAGLDPRDITLENAPVKRALQQLAEEQVSSSFKNLLPAGASPANSSLVLSTRLGELAERDNEDESSEDEEEEEEEVFVVEVPVVQASLPLQPLHMDYSFSPKHESPPDAVGISEAAPIARAPLASPSEMASISERNMDGEAPSRSGSRPRARMGPIGSSSPVVDPAVGRLAPDPVDASVSGGQLTGSVVPRGRANSLSTVAMLRPPAPPPGGLGDSDRTGTISSTADASRIPPSQSQDPSSSGDGPPPPRTPRQVVELRVQSAAGGPSSPRARFGPFGFDAISEKPSVVADDGGSSIHDNTVHEPRPSSATASLDDHRSLDEAKQHHKTKPPPLVPTVGERDIGSTSLRVPLEIHAVSPQPGEAQFEHPDEGLLQHPLSTRGPARPRQWPVDVPVSDSPSLLAAMAQAAGMIAPSVAQAAPIPKPQLQPPAPFLSSQPRRRPGGVFSKTEELPSKIATALPVGGLSPEEAIRLGSQKLLQSMNRGLSALERNQALPPRPGTPSKGLLVGTTLMTRPSGGIWSDQPSLRTLFTNVSETIRSREDSDSEAEETPAPNPSEAPDAKKQGGAGKLTRRFKTVASFVGRRRRADPMDVKLASPDTQAEVNTIIAGIWSSKIKGDRSDDREGKRRTEFREFVRTFFNRQYGLRALAEKQRVFLLKATVAFCGISARCRLFGALAAMPECDATPGLLSAYFSPSAHAARRTALLQMGYDRLREEDRRKKQAAKTGRKQSSKRLGGDGEDEEDEEDEEEQQQEAEEEEDGLNLAGTDDLDWLGRRRKTWLDEAMELTDGRIGQEDDEQESGSEHSDPLASSHRKRFVCHPIGLELWCDFFLYAIQRVLEIVPSSGGGTAQTKDNIKERLGVGRIEGQKRDVLTASAGHVNAVVSDLFRPDVRISLMQRLRVAVAGDEAEDTGEAAASSAAINTAPSTTPADGGKQYWRLDVDGLLEVVAHMWHLEHLRDTERLLKVFDKFAVHEPLDTPASAASAGSGMFEEVGFDHFAEQDTIISFKGFVSLVSRFDKELSTDAKTMTALFVLGCTYDPVLAPEGRLAPEGAKKKGSKKKQLRGAAAKGIPLRERAVLFSEEQISQMRMGKSEWITSFLIQRRIFQLDFLGEAYNIMLSAHGVESTRLLEKLSEKHPLQRWSEAAVQTVASSSVS
jgi:hypothetical protein